jgi:radical SAM protein with 4Fe4S-binding SPASM domain
MIGKWLKLIETLISQKASLLLGVILNDSFRLDDHKLMYHVDEVSKWLKGTAIAPIYVEIGPINSCNHNCIFCGFDYLSKDGAKLDKNLLIRNLKDMANFGVKSVMFSGEGEPLLYESLPEVIEQARGFGLDLAITTNGVLFNEEFIKSTLKHLSWIKISIDAGKGSTHARVHGHNGEDFMQIMKNLEFAAKYRRENNLSCTIGTQMILLKDNILEVEDLITEVKNRGADYLVLKPYSKHPHSLNDMNLDLKGHVSRLLELSKRHSDKTFQVVFREKTNEDIQKEGLDYDICYGLDFFAVIDSHGNLTPCHTFYSRKELCYGNLHENLFSDIWTSSARKNAVKILHKQGCADCRKGCRMNFANKFLSELKNGSIGHINFI